MSTKARKPCAVLSSTVSSTMGAGRLRPSPVAGAPRFVGAVTPLRRLKERPLTDTW